MGPNKPKRKTKTSQAMPGKQQMDVRMRWMLWGTGGEVLREKIRYRNKKIGHRVPQETQILK